ncbi:MAG: amidohydrolase, partial [Pyrinomonadaceae bacterium]|nr:amidohydrolase [Pyrinomonadaceae bacterium]
MLNGQRPYLVALAALIALLATSLPRTTSAQRSAIDTYAITNARIVTMAGAPIERGTIVIRNGLIEAVGANLSAPSDARAIDGTGLTIYPGII